jgi:hypothetical protein
MLVDRWANGGPLPAGRAYATNIFGCVAGPLLAGSCFFYTEAALISALHAMVHYWHCDRFFCTVPAAGFAPA